MSGSSRFIGTALLASVIVIAVDELGDGHAPKPRVFIAMWIVYLSLAIMANLGPSYARLAGAFALLVALGILMWKAPGILNVSSYLANSQQEGGV